MEYSYYSLNDTGGCILGYGETGLWAPANWRQAIPGFCRDEYTSSVSLTLSLNSDSISSAWSEQYNCATDALVWRESQVGQWRP